MGEIMVKGTASKEIICDTVVYTFEFSEKANTVPEAAEKVKQEVERFLQVMCAKGIAADSFQSGDISTNESGYRRDDEPPCTASRTLHLAGGYKESDTNLFFSLIAEEHFNIAFSRETDASSKEEVRQDLLRKAVENSREKAEMIASCAGERVVGIKKVNANRNSFDEDDDAEFDDPESFMCREEDRAERLTNKLAPSTVTEEVSIDVIWLIER